MGNFVARSIYCPKTEHHPRKKILLLLQDDRLFIHCPEHGWIQLEIIKHGISIDLRDVAIRATAMSKNTHFDIEQEPVLAIGDFELKKGA